MYLLNKDCKLRLVCSGVPTEYLRPSIKGKENHTIKTPPSVLTHPIHLSV